MKIIEVDSRNIHEAIEQAIEILKRGGVVAHPTDTVWGLACDADNQQAIQKIHKLKGSDPRKPLLLNLPSKACINRIGSRLCKAHKLAKRFWPGSLSLLIQSKDQKSKIGVRFPKHELSNLLAKKFGKPLTTTSANLSGKRAAKNAQAVAEIFGNKVDLILDLKSPSPPPLTKGKPSTIVDVSGREAVLVRAGTISLKAILQTLGSHL